MNREQKEDILEIFNGVNKAGLLDYVSAWYKKAADLMKNTDIECAFVSTNSISQGEQVAILWEYLFENYNIFINFAYRSFIWESDASSKAHVHCIIVGFSQKERDIKMIFEDTQRLKTKNINGYLLSGDNNFIKSMTKPIGSVPKMIRGSSPCDNGNYSFFEDEKDNFIKDNPLLEKYIKPYIGAKEFINRKKRYCIWLYNADLSDIRKSKNFSQRIENVKEFRLKSKKAKTIELANTPLIWEANRYNGEDFILIPRVSSEKRRYVPIGYVSGKVVANDACQLVPNAELYQFAILTSNLHNAWMRTIAGRLEMRYRYSNLVYNSFPWPELSNKQIKQLSDSANKILAARNMYPENSLADLYDEVAMSVELLKAHQDNDRLVMQVYGFTKKINNKSTWLTESEAVAELFKLYQEKSKN